MRLFALFLASLLGYSTAVRLQVERGVRECTVGRISDTEKESVELDYHFFVEGKKNELNNDYLKGVDVSILFGPVLGEGEEHLDYRDILETYKNVYQEDYRRIIIERGLGDYFLCFEHNSPNFKTINVNLVYFMVRPGVTHTGGTEGASDHIRPPSVVGTPILRNPKGTAEQRKLEVATVEDVSSTLALAGRLRNWLDEVRYEQFYMKRRIDRHMETQVSTHARTMFFSLGETSAIVAVSVLQIVFFRRLFNSGANVRGRPAGPSSGGALGSLSTFASTSVFGGKPPAANPYPPRIMV